MSEPLVTVHNASVVQRERELLHDISLQLYSGEIVTVIGPNGSGKSTLVRLVTGLSRPDRGTVTRQRRLRIGYMPQFLQFDPSLPLTVRRFLSLTDKDESRVKAAEERLQVDHLHRNAIQTLSGGEFQRVLLARAVLRRPQLLVLDEPVQGVDVKGQGALYRLIGELRDELGCGILMVSHDLHLVMARTDRVVCLNHHICCEGRPESMSTDPDFIQLFGAEAANTVAVYAHRHDHSHDMHGDIIDPPCPQHKRDDHA